MRLYIEGSVNKSYVQTLCMIFFPGTKFSDDEPVTEDTPEMWVSMTKSPETGADVTAKLSKDIPARVGELGMTKLYETIELPLISVLSDMESEGFKIDLEALKDLSAFFEKKINALTEEIYDLAGKSFNINSTKQLGVILFEELGLPVIKKTKTGYSTSVDVLEELKPYHAIIDKILEYRTVSKLDSTYGQGLIKLVDPRTEKIYSHFNQKNH